MKVNSNLTKDICRILFWFPVKWCVSLMPFKSIYWLGGLLGAFDYFVFGGKKVGRMTVNLSNSAIGIDKGLSDNELKVIIRNNLQNHIRNVLELIKYPQFTMEEVTKQISFKGLEHLDTALARRNGVIILTAHFGAKQLLQVGLALKGYSLNQINYHMNSGELSFIQKRVSQMQRKKIERHIPVNFISSKGFMRPIFKCLKNNEILIVAGDGMGIKKHMDKTYKPYNFLKKKMLFPTNAAVLAEKFGSSVIPVFVVRNRARHQIVFEAPIKASKEKSIDTIAIYVQVFEKYVRQHPDLWEFWEEFDEETLLAT